MQTRRLESKTSSNLSSDIMLSNQLSQELKLLGSGPTTIIKLFNTTGLAYHHFLPFSGKNLRTLQPPATNIQQSD